MYFRKFTIVISMILSLFLSGCEQAPPVAVKELKIGMVLDTGGENDHGFNEYSVKGAQNAATEANIQFTYLASESTVLYERNIDKLIAEDADLIITVGFALANATAKAALRYPERRFVIIDYAYFPGNGCPETVDDCYTKQGGLNNVTSLLFAEDQPAYLAGVLAGCLSKTGVIATVAGLDIPPVVRYVEGFQIGARTVNPNIVTLNQYIPDFNDRDTGQVVARDFISQGADVLFCPAGSTGLGGLTAASEAGLMAIGVDVDQYLTFPQAGNAIVTSAMKNMGVAAGHAVTTFANNTLEPGIQTYNLANNGIGLAPFREWQDKIPQDCYDKLDQATKRLLADPSISKRTQQ